MTNAPIKVCHIAMADLAAGAEIQLCYLLTALVKLPDFEISTILFNEGHLASRLRNLGVSTCVLPESQTSSLRIFNALRDYFRRNQVDIVHTHKYKDNVLGVLSSRGHGVRGTVRTVHGLPEPFRGLQSARMMMYQAADNAVNRWFVNRILAVSSDLRHHLVKRFGEDKVACIQNAIDLADIRTNGCSAALRRQLKIDPRAFVIGTMGRLVPVKAFDSFLRVARVIRNQRCDVKFVVAGDGPLRESLQAMSNELGISDAVLFLGHRNDSYDVLEMMDLFVMSSLSEGIPMVLLEALALRRPVVATRVGGIPEVVEHGVSGILVSPRNDQEVAEACLRMMDHPEEAERLGSAGRKRVDEEFSAAGMARKVANLYRGLV